MGHNAAGLKWIVIAEFFNGQGDRWLDDFIHDDQISFEKLPSPVRRNDWHAWRSRITPIAAWIGHMRHAFVAVGRVPSGIVACFPQLAMCSAFWKSIGLGKPRIIAYNFNLGKLRPGLRQRIARLFAGAIDCYIVHSPEEVTRYADYLGVPRERVRFFPLQRGHIDVPREEDLADPFIVSMGSAHRDYSTLIRAVDRLGLPTVIVTRASDIPGLPCSPYVTFRSGLTMQECHELMARARICVTPIANLTTASGQITFINAMQLGVPVIATRCPGTEGYIEHEEDGLLVAPHDVDNMALMIERLWKDGALRERLSDKARFVARTQFSDEGAAKRLLETVRAMMSAN